MPSLGKQDFLGKACFLEKIFLGKGTNFSQACYLMLSCSFIMILLCQCQEFFEFLIGNALIRMPAFQDVSLSLEQ